MMIKKSKNDGPPLNLHKKKEKKSENLYLQLRQIIFLQCNGKWSISIL